MNIEKLVKFDVRRDLEDWDKLNRLLGSEEYFSEYREKEKPDVQNFGDFLRRYGVKKMIDAHTHSFKYEHFAKRRLVEGRICPALPVTSIPNAPAEFIKWICKEVYGEGVGVPFKFVTFGLPIYHMWAGTQNEYVLSASKKHPEICPFALAPPSFSRQELERMVKAGFRGFKPYYLLRDWDMKEQSEFKKYFSIEISDWLTEEILTVAESSGLPVLLHVVPPGERTYNRLEGVIRDHKNVKFILAHLGICHTIKEFDKDVSRYRDFGNVFFDTSNLQNSEVLAHAFRTLGGNQLMFGSDLPFSLVHCKIIELTKELISRIESEEVREKYSKHEGIIFPSTRGPYNYTPYLKELQDLIPREEVEAYKMAMVVEMKAVQTACQNLVAEKEFTQKEMSEFLKAFFYGNAQRLLNI